MCGKCAGTRLERGAARHTFTEVRLGDDRVPDARRTNLEYFRTHRKRMHYDRFRARRLFIGSGVVEGGGCEHAVGSRLKAAGMRWSPEGARKTLRLRLCILNQQWEPFHRWSEQQLHEAA